MPYRAKPHNPQPIQGRMKYGAAQVDTTRKRYCKHGHDTHESGRNKTGHCYVCRCEQNVTSIRRMSKEEHRLMTVRSKYKVTRDVARELIAIQECQICGSGSPITGKSLHIDHCHETGEVRGVLCHFCNVAIGALGHSVERLKAAIKYLERT